MAKVNTGNSNKLISKGKKKNSPGMLKLFYRAKTRTLPYEIEEKMEKGS